MRNLKKGSVTIFLALVMLLFLTFCLVLVEGTRVYYLRMKGMQAMELAEFSVLSEYQQELFQKYGVFFIDLDYEQGTESVQILEQRAKKYLTANIEEADTISVNADQFVRATDQEGAAFFEQAVEFVKVKSGYKLFEDLLGKVTDLKEDTVDLQEILEENKDLSLDISIPKVSFPSIHTMRTAVFGSDVGLSQKIISLSERISKRSLEKGSGESVKTDFSDMQLFHGYIFDHCSFYADEKSDTWKECLEYQIEYIISGEGSDLKNLENIMWRIFILRAGGDYLFFHQDGERMAKAQAQAMAMAGLTGNAALINAVREMILIAQAIEEGIADTKRIFAGEKVPVYQEGIFQGLEIGYKEYLYLFLNSTGKKEKIYRCMDIVELETRKQCGYENLRLDHCVNSFSIQWIYQFDSLFLDIPLLEGSVYKNMITRKIYYGI